MCVGYFDSSQNHISPFDGKLRATLLLVFKPLAERFDLLLRVRREQMLDGHVGRRDKDRFRMRQSIEAGLAVVRSEEHTSELQSPDHLVCRLLLEKKKNSLHKLRISYYHLQQLATQSVSALQLTTH